MPGTESTGVPHTPAREVWAFALLMGAIALLVFQFTRDPATYNRSDNFWYVPTAQSLLADGDVELRGQYDALIRETASWNWMSIETPTGRVNYFGFGTSVLVLPVVALGNHLHADLPPGERDAAIAALAARVLAAISVGLLLVAAAALGASLPQAVLLAAILAVATPHVSVHAGGLWSHTAVLLCQLVAVILLAGPPHRRWLAIVPLAFAFYCRPSAALPLAVTFAWLLTQRRWGAAARFACEGMVLLGLMMWHWNTATGAWLPSYYAGSNYVAATAGHPDASVSVALLGHLVSPNRGLFIFLPSAVLAAVGLWQAWRRDLPGSPVFRLLGAWLAAHLALISSYPHWWLGHSFGPRAWGEMFGVVVLLILPALQSPVQHRLAASLRTAALVLTTGLGIAANARGAFCTGATFWNVAPRDVDEHPERVWDWGDLQMFRGYCGP